MMNGGLIHYLLSLERKQQRNGYAQDRHASVADLGIKFRLRFLSVFTYGKKFLCPSFFSKKEGNEKPPFILVVAFIRCYKNEASQVEGGNIAEIKVDESLVAYCGLYCAACGAYLKGRCPGCHQNVKAGWCKIRSCCIEAGRASCAECPDFSDPNDCKKFNNAISKIFGLLFRSDRRACIMQIKEKGLKGHAETMAASGRQSLRRT